PQIDVRRLLEEVAHTAMALLDSAFVWLLALDPTTNNLVSEILTTTSGSRDEADFLTAAGGENTTPVFPLTDADNPLVQALVTRQTIINVPTSHLQSASSARSIYTAAERLDVQYLTIVPLSAAGRTAGVMVLG